MKDLSQKLLDLITETETQLSRMEDYNLEYKPNSNEWSKKEILGHLIDSASNNHHRIVRAVYKVAGDFPTYNQDEWVRIQRYNDRKWSSLVTLWYAYNYHLCHVIKYIPTEAESSLCNIGGEYPVQLNFVVKDYLRHLLHHLEDLLRKQV